MTVNRIYRVNFSWKYKTVQWGHNGVHIRVMSGRVMLWRFELVPGTEEQRTAPLEENLRTSEKGPALSNLYDTLRGHKK